MGTRIGELRESLMDAIEMVKAGKLDCDDAIAISKIAGEISRSLQVEAQIRAQGIYTETPGIGALSIGHEVPAVEHATEPKKLSV